MKSQERLQSDVVDELAFDPKVDSSGIAVTATAKGVVTLKGTVREFRQKRAAEKAAKRVAGVKAVANDIEVSFEGVETHDDTAIAEAALHALKWSASIPPDRVTVSVSNGWVSLEGTVDWKFQRSAAQGAVRDLRGVRGVLNEIVVKPRVSATDVRKKIENAFRRSAQLDADNMTVTAEAGTVTLRGTVSSWSELEEAEYAAWSAPGVAEVENLLEVEEKIFA